MMLNSNSKLSSPSALGSWGWTTGALTTILHSYNQSVFHFQYNTLSLARLNSDWMKLLQFLLAEFREYIVFWIPSFDENTLWKYFLHSVLCLFHSFNSIFHRASIFNFGEIVYFLWIVISLSWQKSFCLTIGPEHFLFFKKIHCFIFHTWRYGPFWDFP